MSENNKRVRELRELCNECSKQNHLNCATQCPYPFDFKPTNEIALESNDRSLEEFDRCTLESSHCGHRASGSFCLSKERCIHHLSEKWISIHDLNDKPTIESLREFLKKTEKGFTREEILAMIPKDEMETYTYTTEEKKERLSAFVVDFKGNIFNLRNLNTIRRNLKL
jgi:hypothetical protein